MHCAAAVPLFELATMMCGTNTFPVGTIRYEDSCVRVPTNICPYVTPPFDAVIVPTALPVTAVPELSIVSELINLMFVATDKTGVVPFKVIISVFDAKVTASI